MESTNLWKFTHGAGKILWEQHTCSPSQVASLLTSPATGMLSIGLSTIAAGASVYNTYQLAKQKEQLDIITRKLNIVDKKLDYVVNGINELQKLTTIVLEKTQDIKEIAYLKVFFDAARSHFEDKIKSGIISIDSIRSLEGDIQATFNEIMSRSSNKDAPIPNWMIEKAKPVFSFLRVFNVYAIESHNYLSEYEPSIIRRYLSINKPADYFLEEPFDKMYAEQIKSIKQVHSIYHKSTEEKQPRLKWLAAFLWETKMLDLTFSSTAAISTGKDSEINLPMLEEDIAKQLILQSQTI